jgi:hypothetical protein
MVAEISRFEPINNSGANNKSGLYKKILAVQKVLEPLEKTGWNDFQKYRYSTAGDVLLPVQRACNEQGLIVLADCIESKIEPGRAEVVVRLTVADTETAESLSVSAPGYCEEFSNKDGRVTGDKSVYKALVGATKYAVRLCFMLPSEDDPERDKSHERSSQSRTGTGIKIQNPKPNTQNPKASSFSLIEATTTELNRLGWSTAQGRLYLQETFNKSTRAELTDTELRLFLAHLRSQSTPQSTPT